MPSPCEKPANVPIITAKGFRIAMSVTITVEMGEIAVSRSPAERLTAVGLGACVALCLYDPQSLMGGMAHIVLPQSSAPATQGRRAAIPSLPGKCADTAVSNLIAHLHERGADPRRLYAAIAGGARIFSHAPDVGGLGASPVLSRLEIGARNIVTVRAALEATGIPLLAMEVGDCCGRTVTLCIDTGNVLVRRIGAGEIHLTCLGGRSTEAWKEKAVRHGS